MSTPTAPAAAGGWPAAADPQDRRRRAADGRAAARRRPTARRDRGAARHVRGEPGPSACARRAVGLLRRQARRSSSVSLSIRQGEVLALIGPSGCGKTTLLRTLNRLTELTPGAPRGGHDPARRRGRRRRSRSPRCAAACRWSSSSPTRSRCRSSTTSPTRCASRRASGRAASVVEPLVRGRAAARRPVGRGQRQARPPALRLSGGQQQRLCIARAIAARPEVLLLDEPCSALDPRSTAVIEELIVELREELAIVIVTHNLQQAHRVADRVAFMYLGDLVEYGPAEQIFDAPQRAAHARLRARGVRVRPCRGRRSRPCALRRSSLGGCLGVETTQEKSAREGQAAAKQRRQPEGPDDRQGATPTIKVERRDGASRTPTASPRSCGCKNTGADAGRRCRSRSRCPTRRARSCTPTTRRASTPSLTSLPVLGAGQEADLGQQPDPGRRQGRARSQRAGRRRQGQGARRRAAEDRRRPTSRPGATRTAAYAKGIDRATSRRSRRSAWSSRASRATATRSSPPAARSSTGSRRRPSPRSPPPSPCSSSATRSGASSPAPRPRPSSQEGRNDRHQPPACWASPTRRAATLRRAAGRRPALLPAVRRAPRGGAPAVPGHPGPTGPRARAPARPRRPALPHRASAAAGSAA